jgi:hypothetical protein
MIELIAMTMLVVALALIVAFQQHVTKMRCECDSERGRAEYYRRHIETLKRRNAALRGHHGTPRGTT